MQTVQKVEQVKHLPLKFGEVARYVIVPGDPNRVPLIADSLDNSLHQGQNREFNAYKGTYKGIEVSVVSTGIGCPSTAIAVEELSYIGAEVLIRIGTSGSVDKSATKGEIFIATAAVRDDGTSKQYIPIEFPAVASHDVVDNLIKAFKNRTGCSSIVNTSFNVRGEPIVCTPEDAYRCFMRTEMEVLVLQNQILFKNDQPFKEKDEKWKQEFELD